MINERLGLEVAVRHDGCESFEMQKWSILEQELQDKQSMSRCAENGWFAKGKKRKRLPSKSYKLHQPRLLLYDDWPKSHVERHPLAPQVSIEMVRSRCNHRCNSDNARM